MLVDEPHLPKLPFEVRRLHHPCHFVQPQIVDQVTEYCRDDPSRALKIILVDLAAPVVPASAGQGGAGWGRTAGRERRRGRRRRSAVDESDDGN